ncbi:hypothetical protein BDY19DRAFT_904726 [Irpex rosettiformis]|uniref:Uncharacterized protein n=1 Tax=Irpex rosettiformis TaxID=378272 RepID=A0ACB8UAD0_9APHY|nr:hypothetical protein BDY19DRAFT_904726 [Irpex rosettiformis]
MAPSITQVDSTIQGAIKSVTIYRTGEAEVVRSYELSLQEGDNEVRVSGLSSHIDAQSVRVSGLGSRNRLADVTYTTKRDGATKASRELLALLLKKQTLEAEKSIKQQATDVYLAYAKSLTSEHVPSERVVPFMNTLIQERQNITGAISSLDEQLREVAEAIAEQTAKKQPGAAAGHVTLRVHVETALRSRDQLSTAQPLDSAEPDEQWKKSVRDDIDAQFAPDIALLMEDKANQIANSTDPQLTEQQYEEHLMRYVSLANQRYEERLEAERDRRKNLHQQEEKKITSFTLSYNVSNASWKPLYDLHAKSQETEAKTPVTLSYRASINQKTGEAWVNAPLVLSTASGATHSARIPHLPTYHLRPRAVAGSQRPLFGNPPQSQFQSFVMAQQTSAVPPPPVQAFEVQKPVALFGSQSNQAPPIQADGSSSNIQSSAPLFGQTASTPAQEYFLEEDENTPLDDDMDSHTTKLQTTPVSVSYAVSHPVDIPSDGADHTVTISTLDLEADISRICIPRVDAITYLQCKILNKSDYQLVTGPVNVFLEDSFVARTSIKDIMPNESFECTLGADRGLRVTYERLPSKLPFNSQPSIFGERKFITKHVVRSYVTNNHPFPINNLIIRDTLPLAMHDVKIVLRKPKGLADAKAGEKVKVADNVNVEWSRKVQGSQDPVLGKYEWLVRLEGDSSCTLEAEWEIQSVSNSVWEEIADKN